jgi:hypothetical protein
VWEIVLASMDDGTATVAHFIDPSIYGIQTTGKLKTVTLAAEGPGEGTDGLEIVSNEPADDSGVDSGSEFKVTKELQ